VYTGGWRPSRGYHMEFELGPRKRVPLLHHVFMIMFSCGLILEIVIANEA
jgi:hypothetical protein